MAKISWVCLHMYYVYRCIAGQLESSHNFYGKILLWQVSNANNGSLKDWFEY